MKKSIQSYAAKELKRKRRPDGELLGAGIAQAKKYLTAFLFL